MPIRPKRLLINLYNDIHKRIWPMSRPVPFSPELKEIEERMSGTETDISDYLGTIFSEAASSHPRLIVEIGVRGGESRFVFERVARVSGSVLVSVDIEDCSSVCTDASLWHFVNSDDIKFGQAFRHWCTQQGIEPTIDVLFIDSSHLYEHTVQEIAVWFPYLSANCKVIFHDTNLRRFYRRANGTIGEGWDNERGVMRAIEEFLGTRFNERTDFVTTVGEWLVRHSSHCNGLTTMERTKRDEDLVPNPVATVSAAKHRT